MTPTRLDSLTAAREAVALTNRGRVIEVFRERIERGVSANLCRAIAGLIEAGDGVDVSLNWALTRPAHTREKTPRVSFSPGEAGLLGEAATLLGSREPRSNERLEGFVTRLGRDQNMPFGRVTINPPVDGEFRSVSMDLGPDQYDEIAKAYDGRCVVLVEGDLERRGQRWVLVNPKDIEIVPAEENMD